MVPRRVLWNFVLVITVGWRPADVVGEQTLDDLLRRSQSRIDIDRADHRLERGRKNRGLLAPAAFLLAFAKSQHFIQLDRLRLQREGGCGDGRRAVFGERAFLRSRKLAHQEIRDRKIEDRIAKELQPLVVNVTADRGARMSQRGLEQFRPREGETERALELGAGTFRRLGARRYGPRATEQSPHPVERLQELTPPPRLPDLSVHRALASIPARSCGCNR